MKLLSRGVTLVELLVATAIALLLCAAVTTLFANNIQTNQMQRALAEVNESVQFTSGFMKHEFEMAGFPNAELIPQPIDWSRSFDDKLFDQVAVRRQPAPNDYNCIGSEFDTSTQIYITVFKIKSNTLYCQIFDSTGKEVLNPQALIVGIEGFQITYGVEVLSDVDRSKIGTVFIPARDIDSTHHRVVAVRIHLALQSTQQDNAAHIVHRTVEWTLPLKNVPKIIGVMTV